MSWKSDIKEWSLQNNRDASRQEGILVSDGWEPEKYNSSMKKAMFDYLNKWHALHIKNMPSPATSNRRNPIVGVSEKSYKIYCVHEYIIITADVDYNKTIYQKRCEDCDLLLNEKITKFTGHNLEKDINAPDWWRGEGL